MIRVTRLKPDAYEATMEQMDALASECLAKAFFDTHHGYPYIVIEFTFPDDTTELGALAMMGNFMQAVRHLKRPIRNFHF